MRDQVRHPEPNAPDLGLRCLQAIMADDCFSGRVKAQAQRLLALTDEADQHSPSWQRR